MPTVNRSFLAVLVLLLSVVSDLQGADKKDPSAPYVNLPQTKTVAPNRYFCLKADTNCKQIKWLIPAGLDKLDPEIEIKDPNAIVLIGDAGSYTVQCYGALGDRASDIASCVVTIGTPPAPAPPAPSGLTATLQAAYGKDTDADRATSLQFLQGVYPAMAAAVATPAAGSAWSGIKTLGDAATVMGSVIQAPARGRSKGGLLNAQLVNLRKAIMADLETTFGTVSTTPITLTALAAWLTKIGASLEGVK